MRRITCCDGDDCCGCCPGGGLDGPTSDETTPILPAAEREETTSPNYDSYAPNTSTSDAPAVSTESNSTGADRNVDWTTYTVNRGSSNNIPSNLVPEVPKVPRSEVLESFFPYNDSEYHNPNLSASEPECDSWATSCLREVHDNIDRSEVSENSVNWNREYCTCDRCKVNGFKNYKSL